MMEQNGKLHAAMMKAKGDKAAARGKADADRMKSPGSGLGADKGRSKAGGVGGPSRGGGSPGGGSSRNNSGSGPIRPGSPRGSNSGGNAGRSASGATGGGKGGLKGSHAGSGSSGKGSSSKGDGGRAQHGPGSNGRAERARGRQERAGTRQAGRQERRSAGHTAGVADRTKDRDQARANRQKDWEDRRAKRAERDAARKTKREAATSADPGRTTLGAAVSEEARRRWHKRRADATADKAGAEKVSLTKDRDKGAKDKSADGKGERGAKEGPDGASGGEKDASAADSGKESKAGDEPSEGSKKRRRFRRRTGGSGRAGRWGRTRRTGRAGRPGRAGPRGRRGRSSDSPFGPEPTPTVEWPDHPDGSPKPAGTAEDDIVDADIVPDGPVAVTRGVKGLPPAPEPHTERFGTSRPTSTEGSSVSSAQVNTPSGQGNLAAQHRTDITFDEFLMEMANIAVQAASDQERAEALMEALGKVADALREMAADLVGDHNISTAVTDLITDLADAAGRMKEQAQRCAEQCGIAKEAAKLAAAEVARVYGQDMDAKEDAGLKFTSAGRHHD
ncbi:ATP/GTP-binding protein [Streptomyces sp. NPDC079189]|uniref:ATP/GTP-binding protein n=1 Tax=Streptomyces sp. NPDC079189 TaxID=3154514 RepID=UPI00344398DA